MTPKESVQLKTPEHINHSVGGTFHYDAQGNFVEHEETTALRAPAKADAADTDSKAAKRGKIKE